MCHGNSKQLYGLSFTLLDKSYEHILPSINDYIICKTFLTFFIIKIINMINIIEIELQSIHLNNLQLFNHFINAHSCSLSSFYTPSVQIIVHLINNCHSKSFLDLPLPIYLIKLLSSPLSQLLLEIVNNSYYNINNNIKHAIVITIINKGDLDPESLSSYIPISKLSIISKIVENIEFTQLSDYLIKNKLLHPYQSAYTRHH